MSARSVFAPWLRASKSIVGRLYQVLLYLWNRCNPAQRLLVGFSSYALIGVVCLSLPAAQTRPVPFIDNLFNVTSAIFDDGTDDCQRGGFLLLVG
jgi:hypothetical protein